MKKYFTLTLALASLFPAYAFAMDLASAKQSGAIGEKADGLVAAISPNPPTDIQALVTETNQGRMAVYKDTATKQAVPLSQVQALAAEKLFSMAGPGQYIQSNGQWVKK